MNIFHPKTFLNILCPHQIKYVNLHVKRFSLNSSVKYFYLTLNSSPYNEVIPP